MLNPDVTSLLFDPDLGGGIPFVVRRPHLYNNLGKLHHVYDEYSAVGIIQPDGFSSASMHPGEDRSSPCIRIYSTFRFSLGENTGGADEILIDSKSWRITEINDWQSRGFSIARAVLLQELRT